MFRAWMPILIVFFTLNSHAGMIHLNQAWFNNDYGHQFEQESFQSSEVKRIFDWAKLAGSNQIRLWFFEGSDGRSLTGIEQSNLIEVLKIAREKGLRIYFTLFDAWSPVALHWLFSTAESEKFLKQVLIPLFQKIETEGLTDVIQKIDLINEADALVDHQVTPEGWLSLRRLICRWKTMIHQIRSFKAVPMTMSLRLNQDAVLPSDLLEDRGTMACADFLDFHSYHTQGFIERCQELNEYSKRNKKHLILGEFGQGYESQQLDDGLQLEMVKNYSRSAKNCGFQEAFAWRLSDVRPGVNPDARFSFLNHGKPRPAFQWIQQFNRTGK